MEDRCVCCGGVIPEGSHLCLRCATSAEDWSSTNDLAPTILHKGYIIVNTKTQNLHWPLFGLYSTYAEAATELAKRSKYWPNLAIAAVQLILDSEAAIDGEAPAQYSTKENPD